MIDVRRMLMEAASYWRDLRAGQRGGPQFDRIVAGRDRALEYSPVVGPTSLARRFWQALGFNARCAHWWPSLVQAMALAQFAA